MYEFIRSIYLIIIKIPLLGVLIKRVRNTLFNSKFYTIVLRQRDIKNAKQALINIGFKDENICKKFIHEGTHLPIFKSTFSYGYSGDFDVLFLYAVVRFLKPDVVVETGVASGRSSAFILAALEKNNNGTLYSIDLPQYYEGSSPTTYETHEGNSELTGFIPSEQEPGWLVPHDLRHRWKYIEGDSRTQLPLLLAKLDEVDIFYHDSDHSYENMKFEFESVWSKIKSDGLLLSDDVSWNAAFADFVTEKNISKSFIYRNFGTIRKI